MYYIYEGLKKFISNNLIASLMILIKLIKLLYIVHTFQTLLEMDAE